MMEDDSEPPPLEDMSEKLKWLEKSKRLAPREKSNNQDKGNGKAGSAKEAISDQHKSKTKERQGRSGFGGFQKGFLSVSKPTLKPGVFSSVENSSSTSLSKYGTGWCTDFKAKESKQVDDRNDDIVRPTLSGKRSGLEFPEVQQAMKELYPTPSTEKWLTDDLLDKIEKDPLLSKAFHDPGMNHVVDQLRTNPQQTLAAAKANPELQKFLQSFCALMGSHLSHMGKEAEEVERLVHGPLEADIMTEEETKVKEIISKPEVRCAMEDPLVKQLIQLLKTDPSAAQQFLSDSRSQDFSRKIKVMLDNGLLSLN